MSEDSEDSDTLIKDYGIRQVNGTFNINSGNLEELLVEVLEPNMPHESWYKVVYDVDLGEAKLKLLPEITDIRVLSNVITRADAAVLKVEAIDELVPWQEIFMRYYGTGENIDDVALGSIPTNMDELVDKHRGQPGHLFPSIEDDDE